MNNEKEIQVIQKLERENKNIEKLFKKLKISNDKEITLNEIIERNNNYIEPPKRPLSAYMFFSKEKRLDIKKQNPEMKLGDISKIVGKSWKIISEDDKKKYNKMSDNDKTRYNKQMEEYKDNINNVN